LSRSESMEFKDRLINVVERTDFITSALQMAGLRMRMLPMDRVFRKLPRLVRDVAVGQNKQVELLLSGGDTEVDKTVVDNLFDPLVHLIRNSIDHGIEVPSKREKLGKPRKGTVRVNANHEGHHIVVRVRDDGKGIDPQQIADKAVEKKLLTKEQIEGMNNHELLNLIFLPGFSTAQTVSNVSGRGVGMDVVKTNIKKLNGLIHIDSKIGEGTEIVLRLPLTLATMQTLLVEVGDEILALPLFSVLEAKRLEKNEIKSVNQKQVITHRDSVIPLIQLDKLLPWLKDRKNGNAGYVILVGSAEGRVGLVADRLLHQEEVVVKSLGDYMGAIPGIAGGTIAGDGRVRLIVDTAQMVEMEQRRTG
jgi:two-component system chemotaxis sensor kinase CheA